MNQTTLFVIGAVVFATSIFGLFWYGYFLINRAYQVDLALETADSLARVVPFEPDDRHVPTDTHR